MTKLRLDPTAAFTHDLKEIKIIRELLYEKQGSPCKRHDRIKASFQQHCESMPGFFSNIGKHLSALAFEPTSLQRFRIVKGLIFNQVPVLILIGRLCFSLDIFFDNAEKAVSKVDPARYSWHLLLCGANNRAMPEFFGFFERASSLRF